VFQIRQALLQLAALKLQGADLTPDLRQGLAGGCPLGFERMKLTRDLRHLGLQSQGSAFRLSARLSVAASCRYREGQGRHREDEASHEVLLVR
jgi:hypothetical protein